MDVLKLHAGPDLNVGLRYDLTMGFARHLAAHKISSMKRFEVGSVFRNEGETPGYGRYWEFLQCVRFFRLYLSAVDNLIDRYGI